MTNIFECDIEARSLGPIETIAVQQMWKRVLRGFEPPLVGRSLWSHRVSSTTSSAAGGDAQCPEECQGLSGLRRELDCAELVGVLGGIEGPQ